METFFARRELNINNPFNAPAYYKETVTSTMDEARLLLEKRHGTVLVAGEQSAGRGRSGRLWKTGKDESLSFTVILRYGTVTEIPRALTLRAGLAAALALESFMTDFTANIRGSSTLPIAGSVLVKWPNDIMLMNKHGFGKKAVGILAETDGSDVYIGIGVNVAQMSFPPELSEKACSVAQALLEETKQDTTIVQQLAEKRFILLEKILFRLFDELENDSCIHSWRDRLEEKLYMKGRNIRFIPGLPKEYSGNTETAVEGTLQGIGESGEVLIKTDSEEVLSFVTGECQMCY